MKQYKTIQGNDGFLFVRTPNRIDHKDYPFPTMYSGYDAYGNSRLLADASSVFKTARIQGVNQLHVDGMTFAVTN